MKRSARMTAVLLCVMIVSAASPAGAVLDLSYVKQHPTAMTIDVDNDSGVAFVESTLTAKQLSFVHRYESETRYSHTYFDMLVIDYFESGAYPVPRLWITYCADEFLYINAVSIIADGKKFTFSDISKSDRRTKDEQGAVEQLLIKFGADNLEFLAALEHEMHTVKDISVLQNNPAMYSFPMILHGKEDVAVSLNGMFLLDFIIIIEGAYIRSEGADYIDKVNATPMKVVNVV